MSEFTPYYERKTLGQTSGQRMSDEDIQKRINWLEAMLPGVVTSSRTEAHTALKAELDTLYMVLGNRPQQTFDCGTVRDVRTLSEQYIDAQWQISHNRPEFTEDML